MITGRQIKGLLWLLAALVLLVAWVSQILSGGGFWLYADAVLAGLCGAMARHYGRTP